MYDAATARRAKASDPRWPLGHRHHQGQLVNMRDGGFISRTTSTSLR